MAVRELTDSEKAELNSQPGVLSRLAIGSNLQEMQKAINAGGSGGGDPYASQAEAEAGTATNRAMNPLRTAQAIAALAAGGGSAYPDHVLNVSADKTLAAGDQGFIIVLAGAITLPASPADGMTFKLYCVAATNLVTGAGITNLGTGTIKIAAGSFLALVASSGAWTAVTESSFFYDATAVYKRGDIVTTPGGNVYYSIADSNSGADVKNLGKWRLINGDAVGNDAISNGDISFA